MASRYALSAAAVAIAFAVTGLWTPAVHAQGMPAMPVQVAPPVKRMVVDWAEFSGRFEPAAQVEVRSQVSGALLGGRFKEGAVVKAGDLLFEIDPQPFEVALRQARANVEVAQTRLDLATADFKRAQELRATGNIPEATFQQRQQTFLEARGNLQAGQASVERAELDLGYTRIVAAIPGRVGRKLVTEGNLITAGATGTLLTTIVQFDPAHFYFDVDEQSYLAYQRGVADGSRQSGANQEVYISLSNDRTFPITGRIDFLANRIDAATGTIRVRAVVPNEQNLITPGLFGRVRLSTTAPHEAFVVPEIAIGADQSRRYVMTVGEDGTVGVRPVELGARIGEFRVIGSGLDGSEKVIVNGLMRARPGGKVVPQPTELKVPDDLTKPSASAG